MRLGRAWAGHHFSGPCRGARWGNSGDESVVRRTSQNAPSRTRGRERPLDDAPRLARLLRRVEREAYARRAAVPQSAMRQAKGLTGFPMPPTASWTRYSSTPASLRSRAGSRMRAASQGTIELFGGLRGPLLVIAVATGALSLYACRAGAAPDPLAAGPSTTHTMPGELWGGSPDASALRNDGSVESLSEAPR
jgi:hypothetical protein